MAARRTLARPARHYSRRQRLKAVRIAAGRDPEQNLVEHARGHRIHALEVLDRGQPRLLARPAAHAWTPHHYPPPAKRQFGGCRSPAIVMLQPIEQEDGKTVP